jgi:hypothetical protein
MPSTGWKNDEKDCESISSSLVNIHSWETNAVVKMLEFKSPATPDKHDVSVGLKERVNNGKREWIWTDGKAVNYINWAKNYPRKVANDSPLRCGSLVVGQKDHKLNGQWKDVECDSIQARAVCAQKPNFEFSQSALKAMNVLRVRKTQKRHVVRGDRHIPV